MLNAHILVVDDDRDLVHSLKTFLEARGCRVATAYSGAEASAAIRAHVPDAIILDIMMETDNAGFQLAYGLKNDPVTQHVPILIVSGFTDHLESKYSQFEFIMGESWPAARMFDKPVNLHELADSLGRILAEDRTHRDATAS